MRLIPGGGYGKQAALSMMHHRKQKRLDCFHGKAKKKLELELLLHGGGGGHGDGDEGPAHQKSAGPKKQQKKEEEEEEEEEGPCEEPWN